jgi:hypothetical protein
MPTSPQGTRTGPLAPSRQTAQRWTVSSCSLKGCTVSARSVRVEEARLVSDGRFEASLPDQRLGRWFLVRAVECDAEGCEWVARGQGAVDRERRVARVGAAPAALALTTVFGCGELQGGARCTPGRHFVFFAQRSRHACIAITPRTTFPSGTAGTLRRAWHASSCRHTSHA